MHPLSSAERSKRWREKNKAKVLAKEALLKRHRRVQMKLLNPGKYQALLLKERLYRRDYRKRRKELASRSTETSISVAFNSEGFSQRSTEKAKKALPKSQRIGNAMVTGLEKKLQLRTVSHRFIIEKLNRFHFIFYLVWHWTILTCKSPDFVDNFPDIFPILCKLNNFDLVKSQLSHGLYLPLGSVTFRKVS